MADEHYIIEVQVKRVHWSAPKTVPTSSYNRSTSDPLLMEKHVDTVLNIIQKGETMEGTVVSAQAHLNVVLGVKPDA